MNFRGNELRAVSIISNPQFSFTSPVTSVIGV